MVLLGQHAGSSHAVLSGQQAGGSHTVSGPAAVAVLEEVLTAAAREAEKLRDRAHASDSLISHLHQLSLNPANSFARDNKKPTARQKVLPPCLSGVRLCPCCGVIAAQSCRPQ
eukprot:1157293-Pelagomonas_calceolata.AAC.1